MNYQDDIKRRMFFVDAGATAVAGCEKTGQSIRINKSIWWEPKNPSYAVSYYEGEELRECENGVTKEQAIKAWNSWRERGGRM